MLKHRLPSGLFFGALILGAVFWNGAAGRYLFAAFGALAAFAAVREYLEMLGKMGMKSFPRATALFSAAVLVAIVFRFPAIAFVSVGTAVVLLAWASFLNPERRLENVAKTAHSLSALPMLVFPLAFIALIYNEDLLSVSGRLLFFFFLLVTKCGDIGAYTVGSLSAKLLSGGNHKIIPKISPKKSWEGTIGGLLSSVAASFAFCHFVPETAVLGGLNETLFATLAGALLFCGGFLGDLVESSLKRAADVKDSGATIPGMGGMLDVIDSLLLNAPLFYLLICS